ncbi:MAG: FAD binding domain-containing protein [Actinobacteria bacterium]|nr:FAD binding domain-containing protein [Actinomycetota bacterium]
MPNAELLTPGGLQELTAALQRATPSSRLLAGGTDLIRSMHQDHWEPDLLIDLSGVRELADVRLDHETLRIGSTTTFAELQAHPLVRRHARSLAEAAAQVGSAQIRNVATVGGNIANASPCADTVTALVALDADVHTIDGSGRSATRPLTEVLTGSGRTSLAPDEAITAVSFAALGGDRRTTFAKIGSRSTVTVARLSIALIVKFDADAGTLSEVRVALGAVGEAAFRDARLEELLEGRLADEESARLFAAGCMDAVRRSIPGRYSLPYKQHAAVGLAYDAWNALGLCDRCEPAWG